MLSESKHGTPAMPLPFKKLSEPTLMNFNVVTTPFQGVAGVRPLVNTGLDLSWEPDSIYESLTQPLTNPVISRPLYSGTVNRPRNEVLANQPQVGAMAQQPVANPPPPQPLQPSYGADRPPSNGADPRSRSESGDESSDASYSSTMDLNDTVRESPQRHQVDPESALAEALRRAYDSSPASNTRSQTERSRSGRPLNPPDRWSPSIHHIQTDVPDLLDVLAAKITARMDMGKRPVSRDRSNGSRRGDRSRSREKSRERSKDRPSDQSRNKPRGRSQDRSLRSRSKDEAKVHATNSRSGSGTSDRGSSVPHNRSGSSGRSAGRLSRRDEQTRRGPLGSSRGNSQGRSPTTPRHNSGGSQANSNTSAFAHRGSRDHSTCESPSLRRDSRSQSNERRSKSGPRDQSSPPRRPRSDTHPGSDQNRDAKSNSRRESKFVEDRNGNRLELAGNRPKDWTEDEIDLGYNCARNYDPSREKRCLKCLTENQHHEFACQKFDRRSRFNCRNCNQGFHWPEECDQEFDPARMSNKNRQNKGN